MDGGSADAVFLGEVGQGQLAFGLPDFQRKNNGLPCRSLEGLPSDQEADVATDLHFRCFFAGSYREAYLGAGMK